MAKPAATSDTNSDKKLSSSLLKNRWAIPAAVTVIVGAVGISSLIGSEDSNSTNNKQELRDLQNQIRVQKQTIANRDMHIRVLEQGSANGNTGHANVNYYTDAGKYEVLTSDKDVKVVIGNPLEHFHNREPASIQARFKKTCDKPLDTDTPGAYDTGIVRADPSWDDDGAPFRKKVFYVKNEDCAALTASDERLKIVSDAVYASFNHASPATDTPISFRLNVDRDDAGNPTTARLEKHEGERQGDSWRTNVTEILTRNM